MDDDTMGTLDGAEMRLGDVPKERRAQWITTTEDGDSIRPFRFIGGASDVTVSQPRTQ